MSYNHVKLHYATPYPGHFHTHGSGSLQKLSDYCHPVLNLSDRVRITLISSFRRITSKGTRSDISTSLSLPNLFASIRSGLD